MDIHDCGQFQGLRLPRRAGVLHHRVVHALSLLRGGVAAQLAYMLLITDVLHAITHVTSWSLAALIHLGVFIVPVLVYAPWRPRRVVVRPATQPTRPIA